MEFYLNDIWKRTLEILHNSNSIQADVFDCYYAHSHLLKIENNEAIVVVADYVAYIIMEGKKGSIETALQEITGNLLTVRIITQTELNKKITQTTAKEVVNNQFIRGVIDPHYNFGNFVIGKSNVQAQIAALTCANNLGFIYNPLFIYGNSGLGKTHLLNAVGNYVLEHFPNRKIGLISGLDFVEGVSTSIKERTIDEFKNSFRELDLLLVDDIQFIAGKEKTHEVFFTIFNDLVNNHKQICLTADRTPSEIKGLEDRIISRFNQGLTVNIEAPEFETSINILKSKISNNTSISQTIDDEVLSYIASNFSKDVRTLEGAINRLLFYAINFSDENSDHITINLAIEAFKDQIKTIKKDDKLSIAAIRNVVCDYYNLTKQQIISSTRTKQIATARHIAMYLCRKTIDASFKDIGAEFGHRDHSTVISACEKVEKMLKKDPMYPKVIAEIEERLK